MPALHAGWHRTLDEHVHAHVDQADSRPADSLECERRRDRPRQPGDEVAGTRNGQHDRNLTAPEAETCQQREPQEGARPRAGVVETGGCVSTSERLLSQEHQRDIVTAPVKNTVAQDPIVMTRSSRTCQSTLSPFRASRKNGTRDASSRLMAGNEGSRSNRDDEPTHVTASVRSMPIARARCRS